MYSLRVIGDLLLLLVRKRSQTEGNIAGVALAREKLLLGKRIEIIYLIVIFCLIKFMR